MKSMIITMLLMMVMSGQAFAKAGSNSPYVTVLGERSSIYARCIPAKATGNEGHTQVLRVNPRGDEVITVFPWYNPNGIVMGWSPKAGKVAVMRIRQDEGLAQDKQIELSFYLGDKLLKSYTTADLVKLGADVVVDRHAMERGIKSTCAVYTIEGCKQVWNTNDYYFSVKLNDTKTLAFDILTGELCRVEKDGSKQRLVPIEVDKKTTPPPADAGNTPRPDVKDIKSFVADPIPKHSSTQFKDFIITQKDFETILKTYHEVTKQHWEHGYSHVGMGDRTGHIVLSSGNKISWMVRPGGLAWIEFADGRKIYLAKEKNTFPPSKINIK